MGERFLLDGHYYQYDLGWLINKLLEFENSVKDIIDLQTIHYADPIQWDITTQYPPNTVVVDPKSGTAYMSKRAVPSGILLTNEDYWVVIFNYQKIYNDIMSSVAFNDDDNDYASKDLLVNDLVWYSGNLYRVTRTITQGSKYIPGTNIIATTIESLLTNYYGRDRTATVANDTVTATGDYTVNAGDIATTSENLTQKVLKDREIDVDGADSVHVDGASTLNVGGLRTEAYAGNKTEKVTGVYTGDFGSASYETKSPSWLVKFPDRTVDLAYIGIPFNVKMEGAKGDGVTDDTSALQASIKKHAGKCIYIPAGVYMISSTLVLPNNTFIIGDGVESILQASSDFTGIMMKSTHYDDDTETYDFTFKLCNITLDGGYANYITYVKKKDGVNTQHGICIKGEGFEFDKVIVRNCGGDGIRLINNVNRSLSSYENAGTSYIVNSKVMFNAYSGIVCDGCVDWVLHNTDVHSNSRSATNAGNNLSMLSGNCKISDCHFFKLYGSIVPASSVYVAKTSGNIQFVNCHIEGATNPLTIYGDRCFFQNCRIYSSFGVCDIRLDADYCTFVACELYPQVTDTTPGDYPNWLGAVVFEKNDGQRNNGLTFESCSLQNTRFTHSTVNMGFQNRITLTGNAPEVGAVDHSKAVYSIVGYMNQAGRVMESTPLGFPIAGSVGIFDITSDINVTSTYNLVNSYTSGTLTLMSPTLGLLCMILNNTGSSIIVKPPTGTTISGSTQVTIPAKSANFFIGNTNNLWKHFTVS